MRYGVSDTQKAGRVSTQYVKSFQMIQQAAWVAVYVFEYLNPNPTHDASTHGNEDESAVEIQSTRACARNTYGISAREEHVAVFCRTLVLEER